MRENAAGGQRVQHRAHTAALGKVGGLGAAGSHHTVCKQAACGLQGVVQKGLSAKLGQQLAAAKVPHPETDVIPTALIDLHRKMREERPMNLHRPDLSMRMDGVAAESSEDEQK